MLELLLLGTALVGGAVYLTTPSYMMLLFTTNIGKIIIAGGLMWVMAGYYFWRQWQGGGI